MNLRAKLFFSNGLLSLPCGILPNSVRAIAMGPHKIS